MAPAFTAGGTLRPHVFLSYRRRESSGYARHVHARLVQELGEGHVFMDVAEIAPGVDWRAALSRRIEAADAMLVLIGREWLDLRDAAGTRRLDDPDDVTRFEVADALRRGTRVVPVLLDGAPLPPRDALPADIQALVDRQAARLDHESFEADLQGLVEQLTGRRLRKQLEHERGWRRIVSWAPVIVLAVVLGATVLALLGALDILTLETRIEIQTLAAAAFLREPPLADDLMLVAAGSAAEAPGPEFRLEHARLLDALARDGARSVVIDVRFQDASEAADGVLAAAFAAARARGTDVHFAFNALRAGRPHAAPALATAAGPTGVACAGRRLGVANAIPVVLRREGRLWPTLALLAAFPGASLAAFDARGRRVLLQLEDGRQREVPLSYVEPARVPQTACPVVDRNTVRGYVLLEIPAVDALRHAGRRVTLDAVVEGRVPAGMFTGRTVVVGFEIPAESFRVARRLGSEMLYGYELHALAASALRTGTVPRKLGLVLEGWLFVLAGGLGALLGAATRSRGGPATAALAAVAIGYLAATVLLFAGTGVLLNTGYDLAALGSSFGLMRALSRRWLP